MVERRKHERHSANSYLGVYEQKRGKLPGCLVDLNTEGIQVLGTNEFHIGNSYKIKLEFSDEIEGLNQMIFSTKNIWSNAHNDGVIIISGFQFQNVDQETKRRISLLLKSPSFNMDIIGQSG